jgi:hypothetical protein
MSAASFSDRAERHAAQQLILQKERDEHDGNDE